MSENAVYGKEEFKNEYKERNLDWYFSTIPNMKRLGLKGPILDLGCGLGFFVEACSMQGMDCTGIEISEYGVMKAKERSPEISIIQRDLTKKLPFNNDSFNSVVLNQVIDHLSFEDGIKVINDSYRVLSNGGKLFIYSGCKYNKKEASDPEHLFLYTPSLLKKTLLKSGFEKVIPLDSPLNFFGNNLLSKRIMRMIFKIFPLDRFSASASVVAIK